MFARTVRMHLKPNSVTQFTQTMERDVIPLLRKQPGLRSASGRSARMPTPISAAPTRKC